MSDAGKKFAKARSQLILDSPFFGSLGLRLQVVEDPKCPTAWTDGTRMGYSPDFIDGLTEDEVKGLICHEILHCALRHHTRRGTRDPQLWNVACDYTINPIIKDAGMALPKDGLYDPRFFGLSADEVYEQLKKEREKRESQQASGGEGGEGTESQKSREENAAAAVGEVRDASGKDGGPASESEIKDQEREWNVAMSQAAQQADKVGKLPATLKRMVTEALNPRLDWSEILRRFVDSASRHDYSWSRPNRRYIGSGMYLPSVYSNQLGHVVAAIDTSGSISDETLNRFGSEIEAIINDYQASCTVIYCDTQVAGTAEYAPGEPVKLESHGGGGTDFRPPFNYVDDQGLNPVCMLYFTDGMCNAFPPEPHYPVLWIHDNRYHRRFTPPFGEVVEL